MWLALSWRELKRDVPDLSWNSLLQGAAWCPLVFATLWALIPAVPGIVWPAANLVGVVRVRELLVPALPHFRVLAALPGELALRTTVVAAAASGYIVVTWLAMQEVAAKSSSDPSS